MSIIIVIIFLALLIFVHELGHFLTAKWAGLRVDEFGFGFPPRLWGKKVGDTIYSINWLPFGGFVKIFGEEGDGRGQKDSFVSLKPWRKVVILAAGATMNFLLGWLLIAIVFTLGSRTSIDESNRMRASDIAITISDVAENSPAETAGIKPGDFIRGIALPPGVEARSITDIGEFISIIKEHGGREIGIDIEQAGEIIRVQVTPRENPPPGEGALGVGLFESGILRYSIPDALFESAQTSVYIGTQILREFGHIFAKFIQSGRVDADVVGPVGIVGVTKSAASAGIVQLLQLIALISLNLGTLNLLPIPALDGGRILFVIIEKIKGSPLPKNAERIVHGVGFLLLIALLLAVTVKDIYRLF